MSKIKINGYYISEPFHFEDWNASMKFEGENYNVIKFDTQKCFFDSVDDKSKIHINRFSSKENYGLYEVKGTELEIRYNPNTDLEVRRHFTILSSDVLLDEQLKEYRYFDPVIHSVS